MRIRVFVTVVLATLVLAACSGDDASPTTLPEAETLPQGTAAGTVADAGRAEVAIASFRFEPDRIEIPAGTTVHWSNDEDAIQHTSTGDGWNSGTLDPGEVFEFTFTESGTYPYICSIHPSMEGTVIVTG
jgi:plastocyanin